MGGGVMKKGIRQGLAGLYLLLSLLLVTAISEGTNVAIGFLLVANLANSVRVINKEIPDEK